LEQSFEAEILDGDGVNDEDVAQSYRELRAVHRWLGNTSTVIRLLKQANTVTPIRRVLDIGCGQGALLEEIRKRLGVDVVGLDTRPAPAAVSVPILAGNAIVDSLPLADVAVCVTVAHHLSEDDVVRLIRNVARSCDRLILLDLVRHPVPLALFRIFVAPLLGRINSQDGQTSIRRSYTGTEMRSIVDLALADSARPVLFMRHTVAPFWTRQVVEICWEKKADSLQE
jgi:2-polyprenyl-3-methyl-5-hydroxy-6-metoxy-1,4-benzoquinol methylase